MTRCSACGNPIEVGHAIVGLPVIRITDSGKSQLAGTEILFHIACFLKQFQKPKLELELVKP